MDKERMAELEKIEAHGAENGWVAPMAEEDKEFFAYFRSVFKRYNTLALGGISLIDDDNAGRDTGAIKQVGGQADDALDIALVNNSFADSRLRIATEQNTMGKNDRSLASAFQGLQNMERPCKVTVLFRRSVTIAIKATIILKAIRPVFQRKRGIGHREIEALQHLIIGTFFKIAGSRKCISCSDLTNSLVVQDKVHLSKTGGGYFLFLPPKWQSQRELHPLRESEVNRNRRQGL